MTFTMCVCLRYVSISSLSFSSDAQFLCASSNTETVHIFKLERHSPRYTLFTLIVLQPGPFWSSVASCQEWKRLCVTVVFVVSWEEECD